ncbi:SDR family oxidoreductase [Stenotrophomonas acidaminiphila]
MFIAGGSGLIGGALADRLERSGHAVILGVRDVAAMKRRRPGAHVVRFDFVAPEVEALADALAGTDVVVNAAGVFKEGRQQSFDDVHVNGPCSLFRAAALAGVARVVQLSALGAELDAPTPYWRSKARGDRCARAFPGTSVVVRPSLVYADDGASSLLFQRLAALPWLPLPATTADVQPIHLDDLVEGLVALLEHPDPPPLIDAVGPRALPLASYLRALSPLDARPPRVLRIADRVARAAASALRWLPGQPVDGDALRMLARPSTGDAAPWRALLRREPRDPAAFIAPARRPALRRAAVLANMLPLLRASLSLTWLYTAWVSLFVFPQAASIDLLLRAHVPTALAPASLYAAAALDAALGLGMWVRRWRRAAYLVQIGVVLFYSVVIGLWLPEYWAHPYGPMIKNLPLLALTLLLLWLEAPRGHRAG